MYNVLPSGLEVCSSAKLFFQGVGESDWAFRSTFEVTDAELACRNVDLVIDGLDTYAIAKLVCDLTFLSSRAESAFPFPSHSQNGQKILE